MSKNKDVRTVLLVRCAQRGSIAACRLVVGDSFMVEFDSTAPTAEAFKALLANAILTSITPREAMSPSMWAELTQPLPADGKTAGADVRGTEGEGT